MVYHLLMKLQKPTMSWVNTVSSAGKSRTDSYALALGYVIARKLALPAEPVEDISTYHRHNNTQVVTRLIDSVNEITPLQVKSAETFTSAFYFLRYQAMDPLVVPLAFNKETAIADFFGLSKYLPAEALKLIEVDSENIAHLINGLTVLTDDIERAQAKEHDNQQTEESETYVA